MVRACASGTTRWPSRHAPNVAAVWPVLGSHSPNLAYGGNPADSLLARFGGSQSVGGVKIATVAALHSNGVDPDHVGGDLGKAMNTFTTGPSEAAFVVHVPLSGRTMSFDAAGRCVAGC